MKRVILGTAALIALAACTPTVPNSAAGVGFDNYDSYQSRQRERDAALTTGTSVPAPASVQVTTLDGEDLDQAAAARARAANSGIDPVDASPSNPAPAGSTTEISAENDFQAVSDRRSIESDAARIAQNRAQYQVVQPTALPSRGNTGPNIVDYALRTSNPIGTRLYKRSGLNLAAKNQRNCAGYASPDQAQEAFLGKGGPEKDRMALDPDGDGYACRWDPRPFRLATKS